MAVQAAEEAVRAAENSLALLNIQHEFEPGLVPTILQTILQ